MRKLSNYQIMHLNAFSEIENNFTINDAMSLTPIMNFDIWKDGCYLIEAKTNIKSGTNGFVKAKKELVWYANKLKLNGMKLPKLRLILDYATATLLNIDGSEYCKLHEFDFDSKEDIEKYDITFENGPNVAQQIYSRHQNIKDSNIFDCFKIGIDWYNPTKLTQTDFRLVLDLFNDPQTQKKRGAFYTPNTYIYIYQLSI